MTTAHIGRVLGLDLGTRRIGVALSDALRMTAQPLTVLDCDTLESDLEAVRRLVEQHDVRRMVVGLPLTLKGEYGPQTQRVRTFVSRLERMLAIPVALVDERFSTAQGERALLEMDVSRRKRKAIVDQVAAQLILQQYLDAQRPADD